MQRRRICPIEFASSCRCLTLAMERQGFKCKFLLDEEWLYSQSTDLWALCWSFEEVWEGSVLSERWSFWQGWCCWRFCCFWLESSGWWGLREALFWFPMASKGLFEPSLCWDQVRSPTFPPEFGFLVFGWNPKPNDVLLWNCTYFFLFSTLYYLDSRGWNFLCICKCVWRSPNQSQKVLELILNCYESWKSNGNGWAIRKPHRPFNYADDNWASNGFSSEHMMPFWCLLSNLHLTTHHSKYRCLTKISNRIRPSYLMENPKCEDCSFYHMVSHRLIWLQICVEQPGCHRTPAWNWFRVHEAKRFIGLEVHQEGVKRANCLRERSAVASVR